MDNDMCIRELLSISEMMIEKYGQAEFIHALSIVVASLARSQASPYMALSQFQKLLDGSFNAMQKWKAS